MSAGHIAARSNELEAIERFLDRLVRGTQGLLIEGTPGIGKTTLWQHATVRALERSMVLLSCRASEARAKIGFGALADLLDPVADDVLQRLPGAQRDALAVALLRSAPPEQPPSGHAVAAAVLASLRFLADEMPLVVAIDDQQWLDRASAAALAFALRRIADRRVGVVATTSVGDGGVADPIALARAWPGRVGRMRLEPLGTGALQQVVRTRLGVGFPRPLLRRVAETTNGNPLFAIELARALLESGARAESGEPLGDPVTLASLLRRRVELLPAHVRPALLVVAAAAAPTVELVRRAGGEGADEALALAVREEIIEHRAGRLRFVHPLLAAACYTAASHASRRHLHRRIADAVADVEERARHLALADDAGEELARTLDQAAAAACRRGCAAAAGDLCEQAACCTPDENPTGRRLRRIAAAEHFFHAGERDRARSLLRAVLAEEPSGEERARTLLLLGRIRGHEEGFADAARHLGEALAHAADPALRATIQLDLAFAIYNVGDLGRAKRLAGQAFASARQLADPRLLADAMALFAVAAAAAGFDTDHQELARARALEGRSRAGKLLLRPSSFVGMLLTHEGRLAEAEAILRDTSARAAEQGEESELAFLYAELSFLEHWRGNFAASLRYAEDALEVAVEAAGSTMHGIALVRRAAARTMMGDVAGAREDLADARARLDRTGHAQAFAVLCSNEALLELSVGDDAAVERVLEPLLELVEATGVGEPSSADFVPNAAEALAALGKVARAGILLDAFTVAAWRLRRRWALAAAARSRGVIECARGDLEAALAAAEEAVARFSRLSMPVDFGRALLVLGRVRRLRGERRCARNALERALALFRDVGAPLWCARAATELAAGRGDAGAREPASSLPDDPSPGAPDPLDVRSAKRVVVLRTTH